jgi:hypothetical protein
MGQVRPMSALTRLETAVAVDKARTTRASASQANAQLTATHAKATELSARLAQAVKERS